MPWTLGPSVNTFRKLGLDCWRTWFIEECEQYCLFGSTQRHLPLMTKYGDGGVIPYTVGTRIALEDAPFFHDNRKQHRVLGPYEVIPYGSLQEGDEQVFPVEGPPIIVRVLHPENGPWKDRNHRRKIEGKDIRFRQLASQFDYFPYRYRIKRARDWKIHRHNHDDECELCR